MEKSQFEPSLQIQEVFISSIQLSQTDRVRLHGIPFPGDLIIPLRAAIESSWTSGIQDETYFHGAHEFKLKGNPWVGYGEESVYSRKLLSCILTCMANEGWNLLQSFDATKKATDKDIMFFEYVQKDPDAKMFAVSFNHTDRIRYIGPHDSWLVQYFKESVLSGWSAGIQKVQNYCGSTEVKLSGNPWFTSDGKESIAAKLFLCHVIASFRKVGYKLYASADISGRVGVSRGSDDLETWVFRSVTTVWH